MEESPQAITRGDDFYVELGEGSNPIPSHFLKIVRNFQWELSYLWSSNERLIKTSEEQEKQIREWIEKSSHKSVEQEGPKQK